MISIEQHSRIKIRNRAKILESAQRIFSTYGYHGSTIEMIAEMSGMSQSNLHNYFKTKSELYETVLKNTLDVWLKLMDDLDSSRDPKDELRRYIRQKVEMARKFPEASRVFASELLQGAGVIRSRLTGEVKARVDHFVKVIESWAAQGKIRPVNGHHLIFMIWGTTQHYADFSPQVEAVMGIKRLTKAHYAEVEASICEIILTGIGA